MHTFYWYYFHFKFLQMKKIKIFMKYKSVLLDKLQSFFLAFQRYTYEFIISNCYGCNIVLLLLIFCSYSHFS